VFLLDKDKNGKVELSEFKDWWLGREEKADVFLVTDVSSTNPKAWTVSHKILRSKTN